MDITNGGDPPEDSNRTEATAITPILTPMGDNGMHVNFDALSVPPPPPEFISTANASMVHAGGKRKRVSSEGKESEICNSVDENILPLVDSGSGVCVKCKEKCNVHEELVCCSCNKFFHGTCELIPKGTKDSVGSGFRINPTSGLVFLFPPLHSVSYVASLLFFNAIG